LNYYNVTDIMARIPVAINSAIVVTLMMLAFSLVGLRIANDFVECGAESGSRVFSLYALQRIGA
jgi:hypothetical protein